MGIDAVGAGELVWVVGFGVGCAGVLSWVGGGESAAVEGGEVDVEMAVVAEVVAVTGVPGEDPHAVTRSSSPTARVGRLGSRNHVFTFRPRGWL